MAVRKKTRKTKATADGTSKAKAVKESPAVHKSASQEKSLTPPPAASPDTEFEAPVKAPKDTATEAPPSRERGSYDGDTAFKLYLREIGQVKLLTPAEEIELAARIKKGDK